MMVKQKNRFDCMAAVLAMILQTDIDDVYSQLGHDGSTTYGNGSRRPIRMIEVIRVAARHGLLLGSHFVPAQPEQGYKTDVGLSAKALLIVQGRTEAHAVFFNGRVVMDPNPARIGTHDVDDYQVLQWWPIRQLR